MQLEKRYSIAKRSFETKKIGKWYMLYKEFVTFTFRNRKRNRCCVWR